MMRWYVIILVCFYAVSHNALAKTYCFRDQQGTIWISTLKKTARFKLCGHSPALTAEMRNKVKKMHKSAINYNVIKYKKESFASTPFNNDFRLGDYIGEQAKRYNVDPDLINAIITVESGYNLNAVSSRGALGLMQLMPATARELAKKEKLSIDNEQLMDPKINISLGVRYLSELGVRYNNNLELVLAAYHAGLGSVAQYNNNVPPFQSTRRYIRDVTCVYQHSQTGC